MRCRSWLDLVLTLSLLLASLPARATTLQQFNLKDLVERSDKVFRGRVVAIDSTTVRAGGGELVALVYRLRVEERFKGDFTAKDGGEAFVELRVVGGAKGARSPEGLRRFTALPSAPELAMDREYLLFTTAPSAIGLSTTVGLGQGTFLIEDAGKEELTANAFGNLGLARGAPQLDLPLRGPVPYARLAQAIRDVVVTEVTP
jgi:hypothetical protein